MKLVLVPSNDPILKEKALPVLYPEEPTLQTLVTNMRDTMEHEGGMGLAAPQVGTSLRIIIAQGRALANPVLAWTGDKLESLREGCLSLPGVTRFVCRPKRVLVSAVDLDTLQRVTIEARGLFARVLQHEIDHLNGILISDRGMWGWNPLLGLEESR